MKPIEVCVLSTALVTILGGELAAQSPRLRLPPGVSTNAGPKAGVDAIITTDMNALTLPQLVQSLLGPGIVASNIVFNGAPIAAGTFQGGFGIVGIDNGIMLSSGNIASVLGPNTLNDTSTVTGTPGDPQLNSLTTSLTYDASTLEFDFSCPSGSQISFQYVFSSEEYNEYVASMFNDVFGFFLNGVNIATLPGGASVAINNVNCGNPYNPGFGGNCGLYVNNSCADLPVGTFPCNGVVDTEMDGLTVVLTATGTLMPGVNHIKLAIADAGDQVLDSNVFIRGQSFTCGATGAFFASPTPCGQTFQAIVGVPFTVPVAASAATGLPGNAVTLTSGPIPAGSSHVPTLPQSLAGQNVTVTTTFAWVPAASQVGMHTLTYTATDQLNQSSTCNIVVNVMPVGSGNASAAVVGPGCAPYGQYPELRASDPPVLGTTIDLEIRHGLPNWFVTHLCSLTPPLQIPVWPGCIAHIDLNNMLVLDNDFTDALGRSATPFAVPSGAALIGLPLTVQTVFVFTPDPVGIRASDGLYLILGN